MASLFANFVQIRTIHISSVALGKRNFRKFNLYGKRGTSLFKNLYFKSKGNKAYKKDNLLERNYNRGVRSIGKEDEKGRFRQIPEMIPELIVPNLEGFKLQPYVSYRVPDVVQDEFTPQDLFYAIYSKKIAEDFKNGKLNEDGSPKEPSEEEKLNPEEAKNKALSTGSDVFQHYIKY